MARALTRWDPFAEITELRSRFDRLFDDLGGHTQGNGTPAVDVMCQDDSLVVRANLPGFAPDEVKIEVEDGVLTVSGGHKEEHSDTDTGRYVCREHRIGAFSLSIPLPSGVDAQATKAQTRDGVVEVTVPLLSGATTQKVEVTPAPASDEG
jgi:HSP20 family protein